MRIVRDVWMTVKIALGTAQFGLNYGVSNTTGMIGSCNVSQILKTALSSGIKTIDTALGYGIAETVLSHNDLSNFDIITKSSICNEKGITDSDRVLIDIKGSIERLKVEKLSGFLLHRVNVLSSELAPNIFKSMQHAKEIGLVDKIGYSVYHPENLDEHFFKFTPDIVQLPANVFDQRFKNTGWLDKLVDADVEIHIRSIFLQGLLLMQDTEIPPYFDPWRPLLNRWRNYWQTSFSSPIEACLIPFYELPSDYSLVFGVQSSEQLSEIISALKTLPSSLAEDFSVDDLELIDPSLWQT